VCRECKKITFPVIDETDNNVFPNSFDNWNFDDLDNYNPVPPDEESKSDFEPNHDNPFNNFENYPCTNRPAKCCMECVSTTRVFEIRDKLVEDMKKSGFFPLYSTANDDENTKYDVDAKYNQEYLKEAEAVLAAFAEKCNEIVQQIADIYGEDIYDNLIKDKLAHVLNLLAELNKLIDELEGIKQYVQGLLNRVNDTIKKAKKVIEDADSVLRNETAVMARADATIESARKAIADADVDRVREETNNFIAEVDVEAFRTETTRLVTTANDVVDAARRALEDAKKQIADILRDIEEQRQQEEEERQREIEDSQDNNDDGESPNSLTWNVEQFRFDVKIHRFLSYGGLA